MLKLKKASFGEMNKLKLSRYSKEESLIYYPINHILEINFLILTIEDQ